MPADQDRHSLTTGRSISSCKWPGSRVRLIISSIIEADLTADGRVNLSHEDLFFTAKKKKHRKVWSSNATKEEAFTSLTASFLLLQKQETAFGQRVVQFALFSVKLNKISMLFFLSNACV